MSGSTPSRPRRVAIVGGGMAGMTAAWRLSQAADEGGTPVEITVYEQSWQLGGKGASGRGIHGRIEEHGLHVWLGYYENAFRLIRGVYAELNRTQTAPGCPIKTWRDAFSPAGRVGVEEKTGLGWQHWVATFRATSGEPGDGETRGGTASPAEFLSRAVGLLADFSTSLLEMRAADLARGTSPDTASAAEPTRTAATVVLSGSPQPPRPTRTTAALPATSAGGQARTDGDLRGLLQQARFAAVIAAVEGIRLLGQAVPTGALDALADQLDRMRLDLDVVVSRGDPSLRRLGELADLVVTCCLGIVGDQLLTDPQGFGAIDDLDFRDWLRRHGARPQTLESALVRGMYDLVFAYRDGDRGQPQFCAGLGLFLAGKFFFDYHGALFWHLQAGMGDVVFAPMYEVLRARGVRFEFFHRLDRLTLGDDRRRIASMRFTRTRIPRTEEYAPLSTVGGLPCFTALPDETQLLPDETQPVSGGATGRIELHAGSDFDIVVLAASIGSLSEPCAELAECSDRWRTMLAEVATVATQSLQLWLRSSEETLGWRFPASTVSGYQPPFDTYASMTHLLAREDWPAEHQPATLGYFCGSLQLTGPTADPIEVATDNAIGFLDRHAKHFWPAASSGTGFRWELLATGTDGDVDPDQPLASQYVRANATGSERYVQSLPGTQRFRLRVDESGYSNLVLAGDWTNCGLNAGCVEAAVLSGLEAANVVLGRPLLSDISGSWYGVG